MKVAIFLAAVVVGLAGASGSAQASGSFSCEAHDANVAFNIRGATARLSGKLSDASGMIMVRSGPSANISEKSVGQFWVDARSFRLSVTIEGDELIQLNITASDNGGGYQGTYSVQTPTLQRSGRISCSVFE